MKVSWKDWKRNSFNLTDLMTLHSINLNIALWDLTLNVRLNHFNEFSLVVNQMFEGIGNLKYPIVQFSNRNTYKFFNNKFKTVTKSLFFGDSNN